jgi:hypothetical protein
MGHFSLVTVGALGKAMAFERIVGPPGRGALLGMATFWIRHSIKIPLAEMEPACRRKLSKSVPESAADPFQGFPPRVFRRNRARTLLLVQIFSALRAQPSAVFTAGDLYGQGQ